MWSVSSLIHKGEADSGDKCVVTMFAGGALVALIDALGHGDQAASAAEVAAKTLRLHPHQSPAELVERCHAVMRTTRGAAISVASFDWQRRTVTWLGVGNVAGVLMRPNQAAAGFSATRLLVRGGVVGDHLPELQSSVFPVETDTVLVMTTDGVRDRFSEAVSASLEPRLLAQSILQRYARRDDDATVLVFRCIGDLTWK